MDVKALAKSKRAHTQHHSKRPHHSHKPKPSPSPSSSSSPSPSSSALNDAVGSAKKQPNEKTTTRRSSRSQGSSSALPANWDRYEEEEELEGVPPEGASKATDDVVLPKSKGADFRYLLAEAQSQADASLEGFPSLDDVLPGEFNVGLGSMLAVRGESMLSWVGGDDFLVDEKTGGDQEASFISLNLNALAETLEKVELSKRLFIEPDLLPAELRVEGLAAGSDKEHDGLESTEDSELANRMSKELNLDDFATDQFKSSSLDGSNHAASTLSDDFLIPVNYVGAEFQQVGSSDRDKEFFPTSECDLHTAEDARRKHTTFEAASAEMELDMLLDSLDETKTQVSKGFTYDTSFPDSLGVSSVVPNQISNKESVTSKTASIATSLDDALDDLLEETSTLTNPNVLLRPQEEKSASRSGSKSKVSDDFDSWFDTL